MAWWAWWIIGGIGAVAFYIIVLMTYLSAKRIEVLQERVDEIDNDLLDVAAGDIPDRLREQIERLRDVQKHSRSGRSQFSN